MLCLVNQSCLTLCHPWTVPCQAPLSMGILQARILEWVAMPSSRRSSQPRDRTPNSHISGDSVLPEPPRKPKNTGVGSLSLLQGVFPTQELNQGLLHCRRILFPLSYQGSPIQIMSRPNSLPAETFPNKRPEPVLMTSQASFKPVA